MASSSPPAPAPAPAPPSAKRAHDDDDGQATTATAIPIRVALSPFGPPDHMAEALDVVFACVAQFLAAEDEKGGLPGVELVLTDEAAGRYAEALQTRAAALAAASAAAHDDKPRRRSFRLRLGDITQPEATNSSSDGDDAAAPHVHILACPCDRRLLPLPDHPASHDVFRRAGPQLASTAKLLFHRAAPGRAYAVKLPPTSELRMGQGVQYVVLACPPPVDGGEDGWRAALRGTYEAVLACVVGEVAPKIVVSGGGGRSGGPSAAAPSPASKKAKPADHPTAASPAPPTPPPPSAPLAVPAYRHPGPPPLSAGWQGGLHQYLQRAATDAVLRAFVFMETERYMVVYDGYPKARIHLLLMPKPAYLAVNAVTDLRREHLDRLEYLHVEAARIQHKLHNDLVAAGRAQATRIRLGYHSLPSLHPLHLHLISQDFDAPALKTKKHWQSFTSPFFLEAQAVGAAVREEGRVVVDRARAEAMLKAPMHCHACGAAQANMPTLKGHLARCQRVKELA